MQRMADDTIETVEPADAMMDGMQPP